MVKIEDTISSFCEEIVKCGGISDLKSIQNCREDCQDWQSNVKLILQSLENEIVHLGDSVKYTRNDKERENKLNIYRNIEDKFDEIKGKLSKELEEVVSSFRGLVDREPDVNRLCILKDSSNSVSEYWSSWKQCYLTCENDFWNVLTYQQKETEILNQMQEKGGEEEATLLSCSTVANPVNHAPNVGS